MKKFHRKLIQRQLRVFDKACKNTIANTAKLQRKHFKKSQLVNMLGITLKISGIPKELAKYITWDKKRKNVSDTELSIRKHAVHNVNSRLTDSDKVKAIRSLKYHPSFPINRTYWFFQKLCVGIYECKLLQKIDPNVSLI